VLVPASKNFDLAKFYPGWFREKPGGEPASWEVSLIARSAAEDPAEREAGVAAGVVLYETSGVNAGILTSDRISGHGANARSRKGKQFMRLLVFP